MQVTLWWEGARLAVCSNSRAWLTPQTDVIVLDKHAQFSLNTTSVAGPVVSSSSLGDLAFLC